ASNSVERNRGFTRRFRTVNFHPAPANRYAEDPLAHDPESTAPTWYDDDDSAGESGEDAWQLTGR
ncbi:hypothetical protein R6H00_09450, partial [Actinotignum timonense]